MKKVQLNQRVSPAVKNSVKRAAARANTSQDIVVETALRFFFSKIPSDSRELVFAQFIREGKF